MKTKNAVEFYNSFDQKLIEDYVFGNARTEMAIQNLGRHIPVDSLAILDIGCGIGWSSHEFAKHFSEAEVEGIDLSPVLIEKASLLYKRKNLSFKVFDITKDIPENLYDAVIMIDVYEHIPKFERDNFHGYLKILLQKQGKLLLSCPSKFHQDWLKQNSPKGLQPVDEDVDYNDIAELAKDIGGEVIYFEYKEVWKPYDYFHAVIEIKPVYGSSLEANQRVKLEKSSSRVERVRKKLNLRLKKKSSPYRFLKQKIRSIRRRGGA